MDWAEVSADWTEIGAKGQWAGAIASFLAVLTALGITFYSISRENQMRPKIVLTFDNARDVKDQVNTVGAGLDPSTLSRWLRVHVTNEIGRKAAKKCRAYLIGIERVAPSDKRVDMFPNDVRQLRWTHDHSEIPTARDLLPGVGHWIDLLSVADGINGMKVTVFPDWALLNAGDYVFTVQVSAKDADPAVIKIRVHWDESRQSIRGQTVPSC